jgi:hypothetical protein
VLARVTTPGGYVPSTHRVHLGWQRVRFIDGAPHLYAELDLDDPAGGVHSRHAPPLESPYDMDGIVAPVTPGQPLRGWFRIAFDAAGAPLVLSAAAAAAAPDFVRRCRAPRLAGEEGDLGVAYAPPGTELKIGRVPRLRLRGATFEHVYAVVHAGGVDPVASQLSARAAGMLCADLLRGSMLVLDFPGSRAALVPLITDEDIILPAGLV